MLKLLREKWIESPKKEREAKTRYVQLVAASRAPELYETCGIPDSLDGRFEAAILWLFVEEKRLGYVISDADGEHADIVRRLHEAFFEDMDRSLREGGVGDTGISKRVQTMASAFYGRLASYHEAWDDSAEAFKQKLAHNVYATRDLPANDAELAALHAKLDAAIKA